MEMDRRKALALGTSAAAGLALTSTSAEASTGPADAALARSLPGDFRSDYARVNGVRLHYVAGGRGEPLILLPGWPETWWEYRRVMPTLASRYRVIAVDFRGMGGSDKPQGGYDKKTMAADIAALARHLGYRDVNIAGHDIGAMVAFSFAINHPDATRRVAVLEVPHPSRGLFSIPLLPESPDEVNLWWFAFNQVQGLPEQLVTGRSRYLVDWIFDHVSAHPDAVEKQARAVFAQAYSYPDAIRAGNGWYQAWRQDIADMDGYGKVQAPMLGLFSEGQYPALSDFFRSQGTNVETLPINDSGHFTVEEQPAAVARSLIDFFA